MRASIFATFVFTNLTGNCENLCCKYVASKIIIGKISEMFKFSHILKFFAKKLLLTNYTWEERFKSLKVSKSPTRVNPSNVLNKSQIKSHVFIVEYSKKYILNKETVYYVGIECKWWYFDNKKGLYCTRWCLVTSKLAAVSV